MPVRWRCAGRPCSWFRRSRTDRDSEHSDERRSQRPGSGEFASRRCSGCRRFQDRLPLLEEILEGQRRRGHQGEGAVRPVPAERAAGRSRSCATSRCARARTSDLREKAIFWLGQRRSTENTEFLRGLYSRLTNEDLKEKILFSLSQQKGAGNEQWLMNIVVESEGRHRAAEEGVVLGWADPGWQYRRCPSCTTG